MPAFMSTRPNMSAQPPRLHQCLYTNCKLYVRRTNPKAQVRDHQRNIERYCRLLATELTDIERQYLHKRIAEERAQLEQLEKTASVGSIGE